MILGIECTAHTFGCALIDEGRIVSNVKRSLSSDAGLIPVKIMEHHIEVCDTVLREAVGSYSWGNISHIALSTAPGMGHPLRVGMLFAKALSYRHGVPIVSVNHSLAHLTSGIYDVREKATILYSAGANTQVWNYDSDLFLVGETLDMGVGHLFDLLARDAGAGFPGGPIVERLAASSDRFIDLPYSVKGMDVVFGGLYTHAVSLLSSHPVEDVFFSVQEHAFAALLEASERAMHLNGSLVLAIVGGVGCNARLCAMARALCEQFGAVLIVPSPSLLVDNAAMIALEGERCIKNGVRGVVFGKGASISFDPYERLPQRVVYG